MSAQQSNNENPNTNEQGQNDELSEQFTEKASEQDSANENHTSEESTSETQENEAVNASDNSDPNANNTQINELKDQLLRHMAELENTRRRHKQQLEDASKFAVSKFVKDLIEVVENLFRATNSIDQAALEQNEALKSFYDGIEMTKKDLLSTLERHGVKRISPSKGDAFDPNTHEAVAHVPTPDAEPGTVIDIVQAGYQIQERLLRPAMVAVAKEQA